MSESPSDADVMIEFGENVVAPVPPFTTGRVPVTCVVKLTCPPRFESDRQFETIEKQPLAKLIPPVDEKVVVAGSKFTTLLIEKSDPGVVEEIPM